MARVLARVLVGVVKRGRLLLAAVLAGVFAAGVSEAPARAAAPEGDAIAEVAGCVREHGKLAVLMLMDESSSLQENDEGKNRVTAAMVAVNRLKASIEIPGPRPVSVLMRLDGFSLDVKPGVWRDLATEEEALKADIADFDDRDRIDGTDYVKALDSANGTLLQQIEESGGSPPCQVLLWFTDGRFMPRAVDPSEQDVADLCGAEGVVTRLRSTGVTVLAVGLSGKNPPDENLLRAIVGRGDGCGADASRARGDYLSATDGPGLIDAFAGMISHGTSLPCGSDCRFMLEPPMRHAYVLIHTDGSGDPLRLLPPRGQDGISLSAPGNAGDLAGASVRWEWIGKNVVMLNGDLAPDGARRWAGEWRVDGSSVRSGKVMLTTDLEPRLADEPTFLRGEPWRVRTEVLAAGEAFKADQLAPLRPEIVVSISDENETVTRSAQPDPAGLATAEVVFDPPRWSASEVTVKVELRVRTPSGLEINPSPLLRKVAVKTRLTVTPKTLHLPKRQGRDPIPGVLTVAADTTPGCVWIDAGRTSTSPAQVELTARTRYSSADRCLRVESGRQMELPFELLVSRACKCRVEGRLPLMLQVDGEQVPLDVRFDFVSDVDTPDLILAIMVMLGLTLVPLALMLFVNWLWVARFAHPGTLTALALDVEVTPDGVVWPDRWWERAEHYPPSKPPRRTLSAPLVSFRTRTPLNPFKPPQARVSTVPGTVLATPDTVSPSRVVDGLPLDLTDQVVLSADVERAHQRFTAQVVIVLDGHWLDPERIARLRALADRAATHLRPPRPKNDQEPADDQLY